MQVDANGEKFVVMNKGRRYDGSPTEPDFQMIEFEHYGLLTGGQSPVTEGEKSVRVQTSWDLIMQDSSFSRGELLWRMALPIMSMTLMLLAIPLSFVNPRAGRSIGLLVALLLFVLYSNTVSVFQSSVSQGRVPFMLGWWPVHLVVATIVVVLFFWRLKVNSRHHPATLWSNLRYGRR